uniref:Cytochrome P450 n=1 Tax=Oryza punctata TaxID=4537 RepID=A0A0E0JYG2_ORYPU
MSMQRYMSKKRSLSADGSYPRKEVFYGDHDGRDAVARARRISFFSNLPAFSEVITSKYIYCYFSNSRGMAASSLSAALLFHVSAAIAISTPQLLPYITTIRSELEPWMSSHSEACAWSPWPLSPSRWRSGELISSAARPEPSFLRGHGTSPSSAASTTSPRAAPPVAAARPADAGEARRGAHRDRLGVGCRHAWRCSRRATRRSPTARSTTVDAISFDGRGIIFAPYGEHWRHVRRVCLVELLSARQVRRLESIRQEEVSRLVDSIAGNGAAAAVDMTQALAALTNDVIARAVFGGKCRRQEEYLRELGVVTTLVAGFNMVDLFPSSRVVRWLSRAERRLRRSHARMLSIVDSIIEERKEKKASDTDTGGGGAKDEDDDLLDVLLRLQEEDGLSFALTAEIIGALVTDIFGAATATTASTLEWVMLKLMRNPRAMEKAKQEVRNKLGHGKSQSDWHRRW